MRCQRTSKAIALRACCSARRTEAWEAGCPNAPAPCPGQSVWPPQVRADRHWHRKLRSAMNRAGSATSLTASRATAAWRGTAGLLTWPCVFLRPSSLATPKARRPALAPALVEAALRHVGGHLGLHSVRVLDLAEGVWGHIEAVAHSVGDSAPDEAALCSLGGHAFLIILISCLLHGINDSYYLGTPSYYVAQAFSGLQSSPGPPSTVILSSLSAPRKKNSTP